MKATISHDDLKKVKRELKQWCKYLRKAKNDDFQSYMKRIKKGVPQNISLGTAITQTLKLLINQDHKYFLYSRSDSINDEDIAALKRLCALLLTNEIINKNQVRAIQMQIHYNLQERVNNFLAESFNIKNLAQLITIWDAQINVDMKQFWDFIRDSQIEDPNLIHLYRLCRLFPNIHRSNPYYLEYIRLLKLYTWNKEPQKLYLEDVNDQLQHIAQNNCLFLQPRKIQDAVRQIMQLQIYLRTRLQSRYQIHFQLFGSLRNKTTLISDLDGDVTIFIKKLVDKNVVLAEIFEMLKIQIAKATNQVQYLQRVEHKQYRIPFIKLIYSNVSEVTFEGCNFRFNTIDLLVNNQYGVYNSSILQKYTRNPMIIRLCGLTKLWAKAKQIINSKDARNHFSSYGINLMTIYFLIRTGQAPYLRKINNRTYEFNGEIKIKMTMRGLLQGFFEFYSQDSPFFKQKDMVCLLQKHDGRSKYTRDIIVNMYDFIDDTNPGRMKSENQIIFFRNIKYALRVVKQYPNKIDGIFKIDR